MTQSTDAAFWSRRTALVVECVLYPLLLGVGLLVSVVGENGDARFLEPGGTLMLAPVVAGWTVLTAAALYRHRRPDRTPVIAMTVVVVAGTCAVVSPVPSPLMLLSSLVTLGAAPVMVAAAIRWARPVLGVLAAVIALVASSVDVVIKSLGDGSPALAVIDVLGTVAIAGVPVVIGLVLRSLDTSRRAAELARVRVQERLQVAREMHDLVANHVTGMTMYAQVAGSTDGVPDTARELLGAIETSGGDALAAMRRMVGALRSDDGVVELNVMPTDATTFDDAIRTAAGDTPGLTITLGDDIEDDPPADLLSTVHRVILEALTNVRRHAPRATAIRIAVTAPRAGVLVVEVINDGYTGARDPTSSGFGIVGLRERIATLGGTVVAGPSGPRTWRLAAELLRRPPPTRPAPPH